MKRKIRIILENNKENKDKHEKYSKRRNKRKGFSKAFDPHNPKRKLTTHPSFVDEIKTAPMNALSLKR